MLQAQAAAYFPSAVRAMEKSKVTNSAKTSSLAMGLTSGPKGAKAHLKETYPGAFARAPGLSETRSILRVPRDQTAGMLDGNVVLMSTPQYATTLNDYVFHFHRAVFNCAAAFGNVVVVFDESQVMTLAKAAEQRRRDLARKATVPVLVTENISIGDEYGVDVLETHKNIRDILLDRASRSRFIDEVACRTLVKIEDDRNRWDATPGQRVCRVVVDGVDRAGAARPFGQTRNPCVFGLRQEDDILANLCLRDEAIGEGDRKFIDVSEKLHAAAQRGDAAFKDIKMIVHVTIDTDSIPLCILHEERCNRLYGDAEGRKVRDVIAMKEQVRKRGTEAESGGGYLLTDISMLGQLLRADVWPYRAPSFSERERFVVLFAMACAVSGCDFHSVKSANFQNALQAAFRLARKKDHETISLLQNMRNQTPEETLACAPLAHELLLELSGVMSELPRNAKAANSVRQKDELGLARTTWIAAYWCQNEHKDTMQFGFLPLSG